MRRILLALTLAAVPAALPAAARAQQIPPLPRDTVQRDLVLVIAGSSEDRVDRAMAGALEGAAIGGVYGVVFTGGRPDCSPSNEPRTSAAAAVAGGIWGGLRGLFGTRRHRVPAATDGVQPRKAPRKPARAPGATPQPAGDERCLAPSTPGGAGTR